MRAGEKTAGPSSAQAFWVSLSGSTDYIIQSENGSRSKMPTSYPENISRIITLIMEIRPRSILDLGAGFGKYGFLCREYLDVSQGRFSKSDWKIRIDGIEAFTPYVSELHRQIYDNLYLEDVFTAFARLEGETYDLALVVDLLEHFEKPRAYQFLEECQRLAKIVLLSVPISYSQGAAFGNELERHRSQWSKKDFKNLGAPVVLKGH
ncbi:MAG: hypothetical protein A2V81_00685, partial [Candidatus Abawacabacteria bacterium RBG_16_42_10]